MSESFLGTSAANRFKSRRAGTGFTLIELIVVMAIILLLAAIALPAYLNQTQQASGTAVYSNLVHAYQAEKSVSLGVNGKGSLNGFGTFNTGAQVVTDIVSSEPELTSTFETGSTPYTQSSIAAGQAAVCPALASGSTAAADTAYDSSTLLAIQEVAASGQSYVLLATNTGAAPVISGVSGLQAGTNIVSGSCTQVGASVNVSSGSTATAAATPFLWSGLDGTTGYGMTSSGAMYSLANADSGTDVSTAAAFAADGPYVWTGMSGTTAYGLTGNGTEYQLTNVSTGTAVGSMATLAADAPYIWTGWNDNNSYFGMTANGTIYSYTGTGGWGNYTTTASFAALAPFAWTAYANGWISAVTPSGTEDAMMSMPSSTAAASASAFAADA